MDSSDDDTMSSWYSTSSRFPLHQIDSYRSRSELSESLTLHQTESHPSLSELSDSPPLHQFDSRPTLFERSDSQSSEESVVDSEFERELEWECNYDYPDLDIASTHANNEDLFRRDLVKKFFSDLENYNTFSDKGTREWFGELPGTMDGEALPLFTDSNTKDDYQIHLAYCGMKGYHTYDYQSTFGRLDDEERILPDSYVHSLMWIGEDEDEDNTDNVNLIPEPCFIIPLGRLFVNRAGKSKWTGYEVFVSDKLEVWILLALDKYKLDDWEPVECGLCSELLSDSEISTTAGYPSFRMAKIAASFQDLRSDGFCKAINLIGLSKLHPNGFIRLLEIMPGVIPRALSTPNEKVCRIFETEKLRLNADSEAGWALLKLAIKEFRKPIFRLNFSNQPLERSNDALSLWDLASERKDKCLKYLNKDNIKVLNSPGVEQTAERPRMDLSQVKKADQKHTSQQQQQPKA